MVEIIEDIKFKEVIHDLGLESPNKLAILPQNFFSKSDGENPFYNEEMKTIEKLLSNEGLNDLYCKQANTNPSFKAQKSSEWVAPILFVSTLMLTENPNLVSIALSIISNFATDSLKGLPKWKRTVEMEIVHKDDKQKKYTQISYKGEPEGIKGLHKIIRELNKK